MRIPLLCILYNTLSECEAKIRHYFTMTNKKQNKTKQIDVFRYLDELIATWTKRIDIIIRDKANQGYR